MEISEAIVQAKDALEIYETRLRFLDCYEQVVGHVAEKIKAASDKAIDGFSYFGTYSGGE
jgi:hypothetical protein